MSNHDQALGKWPNAPLALVLAQVRFDPEVDTEYKEVATRLKTALGERFPVNETELVVYPNNFASPSAVLNDPASGEHFGISDVMSPWSGAVAEKE